MAFCSVIPTTVGHNAHRRPCRPWFRARHAPLLASLQNASYLGRASLCSPGTDLMARLVGRKGAPSVTAPGNKTPQEADVILCFSGAAIGPIHSFAVRSRAGPRTSPMQAQ